MNTTNTQLELFTSVPFVDEVEEFNQLMNKPNNYEPTIPDEKEWKFVYNFILEELEEYREACEQGDIVGILDALCDITYVSLGNGTMLHGLKDKIWPAYQEVQRSNLSKACSSEEEAKQTVEQRSKEQGEPCHYERISGRYIVYRSSDKKVMKSINYSKPNLKQFFPTYKPYGYK
jgi:predicted HAD superfamily Cof-like phosphohydrolase